MTTISIREATAQDKSAVLKLYREVARISQGIARTEAELTDQYIDDLFLAVQKQSLMLIAVDSDNQLVAEIHASNYGICIFDHILTALTIAVHPDTRERALEKSFFKPSWRKCNRFSPK